MGLVVYWYDFVCFGIVGGAFLGSIYVIWMREGAGKCKEDRTMYESLVVTPPPDDIHGGYAAAAVAAGVSSAPRGHVSSTQLWNSCWRGLHPIWLLALRFASFLIMAALLVWDVIIYDPSVFTYYTEWTFALVIVYFAIGTIVSANGCMVYYWKKPPFASVQREEFLRRDVEESQSICTNAMTFRAKEMSGTIKLQSHYDQEAIEQRAGFWGYLMQIAYQTCAGAVIVTDLVFWCIIVPFLTDAHLELNLILRWNVTHFVTIELMGCMHTLNAIFLLLDTAVNSLPFPWFRLAYFVLWSCCYVIFEWVVHACGYSSLWPYPFLELAVPWAPLWYFCLAVAHIPCFGLYALLIRAKNSIFPRMFPQSFVKSF